MEIADIVKAFELPNRLMTEFEVARVQQSSVQTLRNNRYLGVGLPFIKNGRSVRYAPMDVARGILNSRIDPEAR